MAGPLRIFISSTTRDLRNERAEVADKLRALNFEPVFAEEILPGGDEIWPHLKETIEECDLFVLILGEAYGHIPPAGPRSDTGLAVTELEFEVAVEAGIPVLPFAKRLEPSSKPLSEDSKRREKFRRRVADWNGGYFKSEFELARELAEKAGQAVIGLTSNRFRASELERRRSSRMVRRDLAPGTLRDAPPKALREALVNKSVTLLLGAGASLSAGMPSALALTEAMVERLQEALPDYEPAASGTRFNAVASDFEALLGREALHGLANEMVDPPYVTEASLAHHIATRLFDDVITTNFDLLFERGEDGGSFQVIDEELDGKMLSQPRRLFKIHGSISNPHSLVLTESELANLESDRARLWAALRDLLTRQPLLAIGSSLRDPSLVRLFEECGTEIRGWAVMPEFNASEKIRLKRWNIELIQADADGILAALGES